MRLTDLALQNIRLRKTSSTLLFLSMLIGVATVIFLYAATSAMKEDIANKLDQYGSNILIIPEGGEALTFGGITIDAPAQIKELDSSLIPLMQTIKNKETLGVIAPKLLVNIDIKGQEVLLLGAEFPQELKLKKWWRVEGLAKGRIPGNNEIILGSDVAKTLGLAPKQTINIKGKDFSVAGVIKPTGSPENDQAIFIDLATLQALANKPNTISMIETATLCYTCPIEEVTRQLQEKLPGTKVTPLRASVQSRDDTFNKFNLFSLSVSLILFLASSLIVMLAMKAAVEERTREIGLLRAIGFRQCHVIRVILTEAVILSVLGGVGGAFLGMGVAVQFGASLVKAQVQIPWQPGLMLYAVSASMLTGILAALYPAFKAARLNPAEALRYL